MLGNEYSCMSKSGMSKSGKRNCTEIQIESSQNWAYYINPIDHCFHLHRKIYSEVNCLIRVNFESIPLVSFGIPVE